jgi:hypothetical protein
MSWESNPRQRLHPHFCALLGPILPQTLSSPPRMLMANVVRGRTHHFMRRIRKTLAGDRSPPRPARLRVAHTVNNTHIHAYCAHRLDNPSPAPTTALSRLLCRWIASHSHSHSTKASDCCHTRLPSSQRGRDATQARYAVLQTPRRPMTCHHPPRTSSPPPPPHLRPPP